MALTDGLVSFWEMEEASGTRVDSVVASANDLTDNNTVTQAAGIVGDAAQCTSANSEMLSRANSAGIQLGASSFFSMWLYADTLPTSSPISKDAVTAGHRQFRILVLAGAMSVRCWDVAEAFQNTPNITLSTGAWMHIMFWFDDADKKVYASLNNGTPVSTSALGELNITGTSDFRLGGHASHGYWNGRVDQVGFWRRVLTSDERTELYNSGAGLSFAAMAGSAVFQNSRFARQAVQRAANW